MLGLPVLFICRFVIYFPWLIVIWLLHEVSVQMGFSFVISCTALGFSGYLPRFGPLFQSFLTGDDKLETGVSDKERVMLALLITPAFALLLAGFMLAMNEVATNGANILAYYEWARCEADIECVDH